MHCITVEAKGGYNVWAKEKIRYLNSRIIRDPYNPQLRLLMANAYSNDGRKFGQKEYRALVGFYLCEASQLGVLLHSGATRGSGNKLRDRAIY